MIRHAPLAVSLAIAVAVGPGEPAAQVQFRAETTVVHLDVVVRDAAGRPVADLEASDFEVFEDGVRQPLVWFDRSAAGTAAGAAAGAQPFPRAADAPEGPPQSVFAIVFHQLPAQPRAYATRAAEALVSRLALGDHAAVYVFDLELTELAPFTQDRDLLRRAIRRAAITPPAYQESHVSTASAESDGTAGAAGQPGAAETMDGLKQRLTTGYHRLSRQHEAAAQGDGFGRLVALLDGYVGRRAVVLFSEGLAVPEGVGRLETVANAAAPAHVSFYAIDAGGLRTTGRRDEAPRRFGEDELTSVSTGAQQRAARFSPMDPTQGLRPLAEMTGGLYVSDTNDLRAALARVDADRRSYYVLGYRSPSGGAARPRAIEVRVTRPATNVRARTTRSRFSLGVSGPRESLSSPQ